MKKLSTNFGKNGYKFRKKNCLQISAKNGYKFRKKMFTNFGNKLSKSMGKNVYKFRETFVYKFRVKISH